MTKQQKDFYKQLHHIIRLYDLLAKDINIYKYTDEERTRMIQIKRGILNEKDADLLKEHYITKLNEIYESRKIKYEPQPIDYDVLDAIMLEHLIPIKSSYEEDSIQH